MKLFGKITFSIHPFFYLLMGLIAWINSTTVLEFFLWSAIVFISVSVHELGHALTALFFGMKPQIVLTGFGGETSYSRGQVKKLWKQFFIVLNGPLLGVLLALLSYVFLAITTLPPPVRYFFKFFQIVNFFWSGLNLLPVLPMDGGQLLRIILEYFYGIQGVKKAFFFSMIFSFLLSILFFSFQGILIGALFFFFAFQSFEMWRGSKFLSKWDRNENFLKQLQQGEALFEKGEFDQAKKIFEQILEKAKKGILFARASQFLAAIDHKEGKNREAYERLLKVRDQLEEEFFLCLLQEFAFEEQNFSLVAELATVCYQKRPSWQVALRNAKAFAHLGDAHLAGGWLKTAAQDGKIDLEKILAEGVFDKVRRHPAFLKKIPQEHEKH